MDMRTPLSRVRGLGSAKEGTDHFWIQRLTAISNIPLTLFFIILVARLAGRPYGEVIATLSSPLVAILLILAILSVTWHMRLGVQIVIEDYFHGEGGKMALLIGNIFYSLAVAAISVFAILKIAFGG